MEAKQNKYLRTIREVGNNDTEISVIADVYEILEGFNVTCPARQHAAKKVLCSGLRGKGDATQDLIEARDALNRAIELETRRVILANLEPSRTGDFHTPVPAGVAHRIRIENDKPEIFIPKAGVTNGTVRGGLGKSAGTSKATRKR